MALDTLRDVLCASVKDLYSAETQLVKALPKMAKAASSTALHDAFAAHLAETHGHVARLDKVCDLLKINPKGKVCKAMKGLIEEGSEVIEMKGSPAGKDAALIEAAQKVEHYEIAGYGTCRTFATVIGEDKVATLLQQTLDEEGAADKKLTGIAESGLNAEADEGEEDGGEAEAKAKPEKSNGTPRKSAVRR